MSFYKVVMVKDTELANEVMDLGGVEDYLEFYTDPNWEEMEEKNDIGTVETMMIDTVSVLGTTPTLNLNTTTAYKDSNGVVWIDNDVYDEVFC